MLPLGAFEHYGNGRIKLYGGGDGGGIPIVSDIVDTVSDVFDKADNWTEQVGEDLAKIDPGPAIGKIGETFDKEVLQQADIGTVLTVAAIVTQQYELIPFIAAANTAIKGGSPEQIATSFGISYVGGQFAPGISEAAGGGATGAVAAGATMGASSGAAQTVASGGNFENVLKNAGKGAVVGGVTAGVTQGVDAGYNAITTPDAAPIGVNPPAQEFGLKTSGTGEYGLQATQPSGTTDFGVKAPTSYAATPLNANYGNIQTELGISRPTSFGINPESTSTFGEINPEATGGMGIKAGSPETTPMRPMYSIGSETNPYEKAAKRIASREISKSILEEIFPTPDYNPSASSITYRYKRNAGDTGIDYGNTGDGSDLMGTTNVDLTAVNPSQYDLKKFVNATGDSRLIPFKDNKPEAPIPAGYTEAETIGKAEGGLIGNNSTTMVKYSNKPLMGPRKTVKKPKEKKATAGKGLAVRKT
jgi:hypothetical protein